MIASDDGEARRRMNAEIDVLVENWIVWHSAELVRAVEKYLLVETLCDRLLPFEVDVDRAVRLILDRDLP